MRELFAEVLELQLAHSSENTPAMIRRGDLVRNLIPQEMRRWPAANATAILPFKGRLNVQGRDGTGLKTFVPWVRIHSPEMSPSAQKGWYVVYLFRQDGAGVTLGISHGSTRFDGRDFIPRSVEEAEGLMLWSRGLFGPEASALGFTEGVDLGSNEKLSRAYERTTAFSKTYAAPGLPDDTELMQDAGKAVSLLGAIYRAIELGKAPDTEPPELQEAASVVRAISSPLGKKPSTGGQGFGLTHKERMTVEAHAMAMARSWLEASGYENIRDVSGSEACDYWATKDGFDKYIEVKGTTAGFGSILLTANEVDLHRSMHPDNVLIVVHDIDLIEMRSEATGGHLVPLEAWNIEETELKPLSFACRLAS